MLIRRIDLRIVRQQRAHAFGEALLCRITVRPRKVEVHQPRHLHQQHVVLVAAYSVRDRFGCKNLLHHLGRKSRRIGKLSFHRGILFDMARRMVVEHDRQDVELVGVAYELRVHERPRIETAGKVLRVVKLDCTADNPRIGVMKRREKSVRFNHAQRDE